MSYLDNTGLSYFWSKIKNKITSYISTHNSDTTAHSDIRALISSNTVLASKEWTTTTVVNQAAYVLTGDAFPSDSSSKYILIVGGIVYDPSLYTLTTITNTLTFTTAPTEVKSVRLMCFTSNTPTNATLSDSVTTTSSTTAASSTAVKTAYDLANTANTTADACLPLAGGTMTGWIKTSGGISKSTDSSDLLLMGAPAWGSAALNLYGKNSSSNAGNFILWAIDSSNQKTLQGTPSGSLTWNGKEVLTTANGLPLSGGTMTGQIKSKTTTLIKQTANTTLQIAGYTNNYLNFYTDGGFDVCANNGSTFKNLYGTPSGSLTWNGQTIQTSSDATLKQDTSDVPEADLKAWSAMDWQRFRFISDVEEKGDAARYHTGLLAQNAIEAITNAGGNPLVYGIFCKLEDEKDENGNIIKEGKWTIRYEEALTMEAAYLRNKISKLEGRIALLENNNEVTN